MVQFLFIVRIQTSYLEIYYVKYGLTLKTSGVPFLKKKKRKKEKKETKIGVLTADTARVTLVY